MNAKHYYIVGFPASGKTTFLVAFTFMLEDRTRNVLLHLRPDEAPEGMDEEFDEQMDRWARMEKLAHTGVGKTHKMKYPLYDGEDVPYVLDVPDRSGETFVQILKDRFIDDDIKGDLIRADEILFFINPRGMHVGDTEEFLSELPPSVLQEYEGEREEDKTEEKEQIATEQGQMRIGQFQVVDLLQIISGVCKKKVMIKFIISAWDQYDESDGAKAAILPEMVFEKEFPLVYQFLCSNNEWFDVRYWGVSAQGGDLEKKGEQWKEKFYANQMKRVRVVDGSGVVNYDLSRIFSK